MVKIKDLPRTDWILESPSQMTRAQKQPSMYPAKSHSSFQQKRFFSPSSSQNYVLFLPFRPQMPFNLCNSSTRRDAGLGSVRRDGLQIPHNFIRNLGTNSLLAKELRWLLWGTFFSGWGQSKVKVVLCSQARSPLLPQMLRKKGVPGQSPCGSTPGLRIYPPS